MTQEAQKSPEDFGELKEKLREYVLSTYSLQDGKRYPKQVSPADKYNVEKIYLEAIENEDVDELEKLKENLDNWNAYINEKDREEGARTRALSAELEKWVDAILAR